MDTVVDMVVTKEERNQLTKIKESISISQGNNRPMVGLLVKLRQVLF